MCNISLAYKLQSITFIKKYMSEENEKLSVPVVVGSLVIVAILGFMLVKGKVPQTKNLPATGQKVAATSSPVAAAAQQQNAQNAPATPPPFDPTVIPPVTQSDYIKGNVNAPVSIILYSDSQCPYCRMFYPTLNSFVEQNSDVRFVYRPTPFHEAGKIEEQATDCANDQGKYWEYLDAIYTSKDTENLMDVTRLKKIATDNGLDGVKFEQCFTSQKYLGNIDTYLSASRTAKITGTPTSVIIGPKGAKQLKGASSADALKAAVNSVK